jgi:3-deoxy-D-manno-octulosonate 8-phosphate phosphatase (KDO 8-P phosphatase)
MNELKLKAEKIKLVAFDVDGVLTSGEIIYTDKGEEIKIFNVKDGQGMNMLRTEGYTTAIITARTSPIVDIRAKDLGITHVYQGAKTKINALNELIELYKLDYSEVAYMGDDLPDICILEKVGLACCPADAVDEVKEICNFTAKKNGGCGAVREMTDLIIKSRKKKSSSGISLPSFGSKI